MLTLRFASGTIELHGAAAASPLPGLVWDTRSACHRAPAIAYADLVRALVATKVEFVDEARSYVELTCKMLRRREPRYYQSEALKAWLENRSRGVVVLPTGAGKTQLALMAIERKQRATLVVAPTLELVRQWVDTLGSTFGGPVGLVGGGDYTVEPLTVTTYDSAYLHMEHLGARFGLVVFDECHHLPGTSYALAAKFSLAPFRLGLSATPERADGKDSELAELIGPVVYRKDIVDLSGDYLADYDVERIAVELSENERAEYDQARQFYRNFLITHGIRIGSPQGWSDFIIRASRSEEGRQALRAFRRQRALAFCASAKFECVDELLKRHRQQQTLLFTEDNATTYALARRFLIPAITHQTKVRERSQILKRFGSGEYGALVTSKVLNEGIDLPFASVAIVLSGSGSVREHVQRLGRILRKQSGKRALLYELVTQETGESYTSDRRREHSAYR